MSLRNSLSNIRKSSIEVRRNVYVIQAVILNTAVRMFYVLFRIGRFEEIDTADISQL